MMKKRRIPVIFAALTAAAIFFAGCPTGGGGGGGTDVPDVPAPGGKTRILFKNTGPYAVDVYSDYGRGNKVAAVPAGGELELEWAASRDGYTFYLTYRIPLGDAITISYNPPAFGPFRIDEKETTPITIESPASSPKSLTDEVYLLLYNESDSETFRLVGLGGDVLKPEKIFNASGETGANASLVNQGERAWYIVSAGPAADYSVSAGGVQKPVPSGVTEFKEGRQYTFRYANGGLVLQSERILSLESLLPQHTVTFDADGGSPETQTKMVPSGGSAGTANMPPEPTRSGYNFSGWYTQQNGGGSEFTADTTVTGNITVYAKWTVQYTVTFNAAGGSPETQTKMVPSGGSVGAANMPLEPTRSGYSFSGWYTQQNGGGSEFTATTVVSGNRTVYAKWTIVQYTVTFDPDGGSPAPQTRTVNGGGSVGASNMPSNPTRSGHNFGGWYTQQNGGGTLFTADTTVTGDITVYAKWTIIQYTVTFNADGGSSAPQTRAVNSGGAVGVSNMPSNPTRRGYKFGGWYTQQNGGGVQFTADTTVTGNITVYAKWTIVQYTVTFDPDGGVPAPQTRTVNSGGSVGASNMPSNPTRSGYGFAGWYTQQNGGGTLFTASTVVSGNITVYARWTDPGSSAIQISLRPAPDDPPLANTSLLVHESAQFSAGSGYGSYVWYWNGEVISGAGSSTYTLAANSKAPGVYELSVVVTTGTGEILSARCRVAIRVN
jgi:uncharacterized repeat protein (TIGR02543 family)